jgi:hypothetical protein
MKTSYFNGINTGKLDFDYNVRYRPRTDVSILGMENQIKYLFRDINYEYISFVWENDRYTKHKHSHSLIKTDDTDFIQKIQKNILSSKEPIIETNSILIRKYRTLTSVTSGEKTQKEQDTWENVESTRIIGRNGDVYIEPVLNVVSSSIYNHKYTDHGVNFGYIKPTLIYQTP